MDIKNLQKYGKTSSFAQNGMKKEGDARIFPDRVSIWTNRCISFIKSCVKESG